MVKSQLEKLGKSYWGTLSKVVNTWRSYGNNLEFHKSWAARFGVDRARQTCRHLPARALSGRWGSKWATEEHFLLCTKMELQTIWQDMFLNKEAKPSKRRRVELTDDGEETYAEVRSRWIREASEGVLSRDFWCQLYISHTTSSPLAHLQHWLQGFHAESEKRHRCLIDFVIWKAKQISFGWTHMILTDGYFTDLEEEFSHGHGDADEIYWRTEAVSHVLLLRGAFAFRIDSIVGSYPLLLLWLIWSPFDAVCEDRRQCAADLLQYINLPVHRDQ